MYMYVNFEVWILNPHNVYCHESWHKVLSLICFWPAGFDENLAVQGELILQDTFQVWDPKSLIRKGRDRHLFLFEISLVFSKEMKDSSGRTKYVYKSKLLVGQPHINLRMRKNSRFPV